MLQLVPSMIVAVAPMPKNRNTAMNIMPNTAPIGFAMLPVSVSFSFFKFCLPGRDYIDLFYVIFEHNPTFNHGEYHDEETP